MNHLDVTLDEITTFTLMEEIDHPDLDNSELASEELVTKYMCMIGQLQWVFTLGRFDFWPMQCQCHGLDMLLR